jgi:hypothetical protein
MPRRASGSLLAALLLLAGCRRVPATGPGDRAGLDAQSAADSAKACIDGGRFFEAVPYLHRLEALDPDRPPEFHSVVARVLANAAVQPRDRDGLVSPATRSSVERVGMLRESIARYELAIGASRSAADSSRLYAERAQLFAIWGAPIDAILDWQRANRCRRLEGPTLVQARLVAYWIGHPVDARAPSPAAATRAPK